MLPEDKVVATDMQLSAPALQVADVKLQVPAVYAPQYIDVTLEICKKYAIDALISLNDLELPILAAQKARFEELGVTVIVSDPRVIDIAFDKYLTTQWVENLGLKAPKSYVNLKAVKEALERKETYFPLFLKPRWGSGSIGLETVEDMEDWVAWRQKFIAKIPRKYRKNATFVFAGETVDSHLSVIRDKNDRPLYVEAAGLDMDDTNEGRFLGKPCQIVDSSILEDVDSAEAGEFVGIFGDFSKYAINTNKQFVVDKWEDKNSNKVITRGLAVVDGKMLLPNAFFLIKKKASTPSM